MTSSSGLPLSSWISSPAFRPIRSASEPGSTATTRSTCSPAPRCGGASRYSCTALRTYADAENCFLVLLIGLPLTQTTHEIVQAGKHRHQPGRVKKDVQFRHNN